MKKYSISRFKCQRDQFHISGTIYRSNKQDSQLVPVIICHGFLANQKEGRPVAIALAEAGYVAITFDFVGGCTAGKSDGKLTDMTIFTEKADLRCVMDYLKTLEFVDTSSLVLAGCSQGGLVAGLMASDYPKEVRSLILLYPALCIPDDARKGQMQMFRFEPSNVPDVIEAQGSRINGDYARLILDMDAIDVISNYAGPVLLVCGKKDPVVSYDYMERLIIELRRKRKSGDKPDKTVQFFPLQEALHGFQGQELVMVSQRIIDFLNDYDEILTIYVNITGNKSEHSGLFKITYLSFDAECMNNYFHGKTLPGAVDMQKRKFGRKVEFRAEYTLRGTDYMGKNCDIHIVNLDTGNGWGPSVETDSDALAYMNGRQCITIAESYEKGIIIHILN